MKFDTSHLPPGTEGVHTIEGFRFESGERIDALRVGYVAYGRLAAARDNVTKPVLLLDAMAKDVLGALGDGALEADRLRMMLYLAWPYGSLVAEAEALLARDTSDAYYEPGVLDHGALVMLALATIHIAPSQTAAPLGLRAIHGLALASSAAEVIGRLDPELPDASAMGAVLQTLYLFDALSAATGSSVLQLFSIDPVERARWRCLSRLLDPERSPFLRRELGSYGVWPGGFSHPIVEVSPNRAAPGDVITLVFDGRELGQGDHVVFAAPDRPPIEAEFFNQRRDDDLGPRLIDVRVPEGVSPGWVGVSNDDLIEQSNLHRGELQLSLPAALAGHTCLRESALPAEQPTIRSGQVSGEPEPVTKRAGQEPRPGSGSDEGEGRQLQWDCRRSGPFANDHVDSEVFHGYIEHLFCRARHPVDLVDEQHITFVEA